MLSSMCRLLYGDMWVVMVVRGVSCVDRHVLIVVCCVLHSEC